MGKYLFSNLLIFSIFMKESISHILPKSIPGDTTPSPRRNASAGACRNASSKIPV